MRLLTPTLAALALTVVGCGGAAPLATSTPGVPGSAQPSAPVTSGPQTPAPASAPTVTVAPGTPAPVPTTGGGGVVGPVFTGPLNAAFPPVLGGEQVQVLGPIPGDQAENLDASTRALIEQLGLDLADVEVAFATDSGASVIIFGVRFPGIESTALDSAYIGIQEAAPGTSNFRVVPIAGRNVHAFDSLIGTTYSWVNGDILFTVYGTEQGAQQAIASMPLPTVALTPGGEVLADVLIDVTISGGEHAGAYHGETSTGGCSRNALGENQFGLQYTDDANAQGFTSLQVIARDAAGAEAGGTDDFVATLQIGPMSSGTTYNVDPAEGDGSGTLTIESTDVDSAVASISATTADGVAFQATITCNVVFDFGSGS